MNSKRPRFSMVQWPHLRFGLWALLLAVTAPAYGQWLTQRLAVPPGWSAVYLHVDASYATIDSLVAADPNNPIEEIWLWQAPPTTVQFFSTPTPLAGSSQWANWVHTGGGFTGNLTRLIPNAAYLIHSVATSNYTWQVLGAPVAPSYTWTTTGLNLLGFPTPPTNPPTFQQFFSLAPILADPSQTQVYQYPGGDLGATNPARLFSFYSANVTRGQAFWVRSTNSFNQYFGPFQVALPGAAGVAFGNAAGQIGFHLSNVTATNVTVALALRASESAPAGQPFVVGTPPVLVRGALNPTNLTYPFATLAVGGAAQSWTLAPQGQSGSDIVIVLGINRYAMAGNAGDLYAGILQFTDSFHDSEIDVPVSAQVGSSAGLWVGNASVSQVGNYLKVYQRDTNNNLVVATNGAYVVTNTITGLGAVTQPFPLRLILHNDGTNVVLLQRVFYGMDPGSNTVIATAESLLDPARLGNARRISSVNWPWTGTNTAWPFVGTLAAGGTLTSTITVPYDDQASSPFLHTYHPDHDNLDATFKQQLNPGGESYDMMRQVTLNITPPSNDFASLTQAGQTFYGTYQESVVLVGLGGASRTFNSSGSFAINRISPIASLSRP